jgi:uncharacterized protein (TIGR02246 family)
LRGARGMDEAQDVRLLGDDAAVVVSLSGFAHGDKPADVRRATWTLSRRDGAWSVDAYANCPTAN